MVSVYSASHFLIDFACAFLMFRSISLSPDWYVCVLIYNFCAFAMQMPLGIVADKLNHNSVFAGIGCILVVAAYGLTSLPLMATIVVGLGNGMFHIGGGVDILNICEKKSSALGIFVSPGAFGIYFGTILGRGSSQAAFPIIIMLLASAALVFAVRRSEGVSYANNAPLSLRAAPWVFAAALCMFLVVCLRSFVGLAVSFPWRSAGYWGLALVCASAFGKTLGGFLSDWIGPIRAAAYSLGLATLLFIIPQFPVAGVAAMLLFNMSMPITLWATAKIFPGAKGFAFGLLTFALFLGFAPVHLGVAAPLWLFALATAVSLALIICGLAKSSSHVEYKSRISN